MRKLNKKGFTLIELLAVIVIMGILMVVAIPAVSRTIENSRRSTFANTISEYMSSVKNAYLAETLSCEHGVAGTFDMISSCPAGTYWVPISSQEYVTNPTTTPAPTSYGGSNIPYDDAIGAAGNSQPLMTIAYNNFKELVESGGKSAFGNAHAYGYIKIEKGTDGKMKYYARIVDNAGNGNDTEQNEVAVGQRTSVTVGGRTAHFLPNNTTAVTVPSTANVDPRLWVCKFAA